MAQLCLVLLCFGAPVALPAKCNSLSSSFVNVQPDPVNCATQGIPEVVSRALRNGVDALGEEEKQDIKQIAKRTMSAQVRVASTMTAQGSRASAQLAATPCCKRCVSATVADT